MPPAPETALEQQQENFLAAFRHYIRIDVSSGSADANVPHALPHFLRLAAISVLKETVARVQRQRPSSTTAAAVFWPSLFAFSAAEAQLSASVRQHRGCFLVGLTPRSSSSSCARNEDHGRVEDERAQSFFGIFSASFDVSVRGHRVWVDEPVEPTLRVRLVRREQLGRLVVDEAMWPHPHARALLVHRCQGGGSGSGNAALESSDAYYAPTEDELTRRSGDGASTLPTKKLRPAADVLNRLRWDAEFDADQYTAVYLDRFTGYQELAVSAWKSDTSDDDFIPQHRIVSFRSLHTGEVVWSRALRIDKVFG